MFKKILKGLASLRLTVLGLIILMILTIWGTLYQAEFGLYLAQERFYQSWFFLIGGMVPFPGAQTVMVVLFINLLAAILQLGLRGKLNWGMLITHLGLLMMLSAGAVTFYLGNESQLTLEEGEASNVAVSYANWELALLTPVPGDQQARQVFAVDASVLKPGRTLELPWPGLAIRIESFHRNCQAVQQSVSSTPPRSGSGYTALRSLPVDKEPGRNLPGVIFTLIRNGEEDGRYLLWGNDPNASILQAEESPHLIGLRRSRLPLPALIDLVDFRRELHPGSSIAKSYSSLVTVTAPGDEEGRKVLISMNKPLRLQGFTFYQSSFASSPGGREISTLSVVFNYGRLMPYIATGLTVIGMLFHFTGMLVHRLRHRHLREVAS